MAGDWIAIRTDLHEDPAVIGIARLTGLDPYQVVGRLVRLWSWADAQSRDGLVPHASARWIDSHLHCERFAVSMSAVGWLNIDDDAVSFPNFERWMGESAKSRLTDACRKRLARKRDGPKPARPRNVRKKPDKSRTRGEERERREEIKDTPLTPQGGAEEEIRAPTVPEFLAAWNAVRGFRGALDLTNDRLRHFQARVHNRQWVASWREALARAAALPFCLGAGERGWRATVDWFLKPGTVTKILEGTYDRLACKGHPPRPVPTEAERAAAVQKQREEVQRKAELAAPTEEIRKLLDQAKRSRATTHKPAEEPPKE